MPTLKETLDLVRVGETEKGKGVFANTAISNGIVITSVRGQHVTFEDTTTLGYRESFCVQIDLKDYVLPNPPFYLVNHSCEPNCGLNANLELVTLRTIAKDEEVTWDYSTSMLERHWTMKCECGSQRCRGAVTDFDLLPPEVQRFYLDRKLVLPFIIGYLEGKAKTDSERAA
jgi:uncharacterized protein